MRSADTLLRVGKGRLIIALGISLFLTAVVGRTAEQKTPATQKRAPEPAACAPIPAPDVAAKSTEVTNILVGLSAKFASSLQIEKIQKSFDQATNEIEREFSGTVDLLLRQPTLSSLQAQQALWKSRQLQISTWLDVLTKQAVDLQDALSRLGGLQATWTQTREAAHASQASAATLQQIETVLTAIEAAQVPLRAQHDGLLDLQSRVSEELRRCDDALTRIALAQKGVVAGILTREHPPIWSAEQWEHARKSVPARFSEIVSAFKADTARYIRDPSREMPLQVGLFVLLAGVFLAARRLMHRWTSDAQKAASLVSVFERPYAAALFTVWFVATRYNSPTPPMVKELFAALALVPIVRLVQPAISPGMMPGIYILAVFCAFDICREVFGGTAVVEQVLLLLEGMAGIMVLVRLLASGYLHHAFAKETGTGRTKAIEVICKVIMFYLAGGVVAGTLGYMRLGRIITPGVISASALAPALYAGVRVFGGVVALVLRIWPLRLLQMVRQHRDLLEKRIYRLLVWLAVLGWAVRSFDYIGLLDPMVSMGSAVLATKLERGSISISIGDILAFVVTIWASYLLSSFIRFVLREEVYPRARIPRGTAYASSRLINYTILALGFVVGLGVLGMDLSKVTVLAGAFGVGIGFGLQSVVNNFVCGLILLFERPIHVGDSIEVGDLLGEVRRIGFRASTVRSRQGADIIIPNAQFITANVTNWTFSDQLRRIDLRVSVNYGATPKRVIELLEEVARSHPQVLRNPAPRCLFMAYGESSINFELRAWTDQFAEQNKIRSDLNAAVYDAVNGAGISFPFPQREVRLLRDPTT